MPVQLFTRLVRGTVDASDVPALDTLASLGLRERAPWIGALAPALEHADPVVRAAAVRALSGARGLVSFRRLAAALDDGDPGVRKAAVASLRASSANAPARWALAIFHRDPEVRIEALGAPPPMGCESLPIYLLADPRCASLVELPRLTRAIGPILHLVLAGALGRDAAREWIESNLSAQLVTELFTSRWRTAGELAPILDGDEAGILDDDMLDVFFALWIGDDVDEVRAQKTLAAFRTLALGRPDGPKRIAASLLAMLRHGAKLPDAFAALLGLVHPRILLDVRVDRALRTAAIEGLVAHGPSPRREPDVAPFLDGDLAWKDGALDLRYLAAAIAAASTANAGHVIFAKFGAAALVDGFVAAPERSAPILAHPLHPKEPATWLLDRLRERLPGKRGLVFALAIAAYDVDRLDWIGDLDPRLAIEAALAIEDARSGPNVRFTPNKLDAASAALARRIGVTDATITTFLAALADRMDPPAATFLLDVLAHLATTLSAARWVASCIALDVPRLERLVLVFPHASRMPIAKEMALASAIVSSPSATLAGWAESRLPRPAMAEPPTPRGVRALAPAEIAAIRGATSLAALEAALAPALARPTTGLAAVLADRGAIPSAVVCAAVIASHDDPRAVAREIERHSLPGAPFLSARDHEIAKRWVRRHAELPILANAWLHRWEQHAFALIDALEAAEGGVLRALEGALALGSPELARAVWGGVATVFEMWRWRDAARLEKHATPAMVDFAVAELELEVGEEAARIFAAIAGSGVAPSMIRARIPAIEKKLPEVPLEVREKLRGLVDGEGVAVSTRAGRARPTTLEADVIERVRTLVDLDELARMCRGAVEKIVHEAALRLLTRGGAAGEKRIVDLLALSAVPPCVVALADAIALFESKDAIDAAEALVRARTGAAAKAETRFAIAMALVGIGRTSMLADAMGAACEGPPGWLRQTDVERLQRVVPAAELARALAVSPHPHAYDVAMSHLLAIHGETPEENVEAVRAFLEQGPTRRATLRASAAVWLSDRNDRLGAPLLLARALVHDAALPTSFVKRATDALVLALAEGALGVGSEQVPELRAVDLVDRMKANPSAREEALRRILDDGNHAVARQRARALLVPAVARDRKLRDVAEIFAWGVLLGRELTGKLLRFHITDSGQLGYATMKSGDVHVTPLPIFRGERDGREIVEGLVLHEIGHHVWHSSDEALALWKTASEMGLGRLFNLVLDEHLERNLRAMEADWGDRLKTLAAWAFRHSRTDVKIDLLLFFLRARSFDVLTKIELGVARPFDAVRVESGALLAELDQGGHSFSRFVRGLRMGLGDRAGDEKVERALALFDRRFRKADVQRLWEITLELQKIFGQDVDLALGLSGSESIGEGGELPGEDEGIGDADVQREVQRILEAPSQSGRSGTGGGGRAINVGPDESWHPITRVVPLPPDPAKHAPFALEVRRHADRMRRTLEELGVRWEPQRGRLSGRRVDTTRLRALVTRGDPRVLVARETRLRTDLFLGLAIDCSGSMKGEPMRRAHAFGVLLAEAARGLRNVDFRAFGFTDREIFDAGDANRSAIASLEATTGNNDAAALWHVGSVAKRSPRRAKLVVMISDGLPTECSVGALRSCVNKVSRSGVACAQVAVRPLEEVCFPHHVLIEGGELDAAVARFGAVITNLVRKVMA